MVFLYAFIVAALLFFAHKATRVKGLLNAALWLAGTSCFTSIILYIMGSPAIAAIELSVGAGLVTVLFVFAISIIGDEDIHTKFTISPWLAGMITITAFVMLAVLSWEHPFPAITAFHVNMTQADILSETIWQDRQVDTYLQGALIITGVLGILLLIAPSVAQRIKEGKKND